MFQPHPCQSYPRYLARVVLSHSSDHERSHTHHLQNHFKTAQLIWLFLKIRLSYYHVAVYWRVYKHPVSFQVLILTFSSRILLLLLRTIRLQLHVREDVLTASSSASWFMQMAVKHWHCDSIDYSLTRNILSNNLCQDNRSPGPNFGNLIPRGIQSPGEFNPPGSNFPGNSIPGSNFPGNSIPRIKFPGEFNPPGSNFRPDLIPGDSPTK